MEDPSPQLLDRVARLAGAAVTSTTAAQGGCTPAGRWVAKLANGSSCFVKASSNDDTAGWLRAEMRVYGALQAPWLPRLVGWDDDGAQPVLVLEDLSHALWPPPWTMGPIRRLQDTLAKVAATPPPKDVPSLESMRDDLSGWKRVAADPKPFLSLNLCSSVWLEKALPTFIAAEKLAFLDGDHLVHLDVRSDNVCFTDDRVVLVDWNWACRGNARVDLAFWAPSLAAEGGPKPEETCPGPAELAALVAGYFASKAGLPGEGPLARVRDLQRMQLRPALPWAARAWDLPPPDGTSKAPSGDTKKHEEWIF